MKSYKQKPAFKPSIMGTPCLRKLFYSYNRIPEDYKFPLNAQRLCLLGDYVHDMLSDTFRKVDMLIDYKDETGKTPINKYSKKEDPEFPVKDHDLEISAKIDAILMINPGDSLTAIFDRIVGDNKFKYVLEDEELWIGEYKSINDNGFKGLKKPKSEHLDQGMIYYFIFNQALKEGKFKHIKQLDKFTEVKGVRFLYLNKNNSEMREFICQANQALFTNLIYKMQQIKQFTTSKTLPPTSYDWCKSCSWRRKCVANRLK